MLAHFMRWVRNQRICSRNKKYISLYIYGLKCWDFSIFWEEVSTVGEEWTLDPEIPGSYSGSLLGK